MNLENKKVRITIISLGYLFALILAYIGYYKVLPNFSFIVYLCIPPFYYLIKMKSKHIYIVFFYICL